MPFVTLHYCINNDIKNTFRVKNCINSWNDIANTWTQFSDSTDVKFKVHEKKQESGQDNRMYDCFYEWIMNNDTWEYVADNQEFFVDVIDPNVKSIQSQIGSRREKKQEYTRRLPDKFIEHLKQIQDPNTPTMYVCFNKGILHELFNAMKTGDKSTQFLSSRSLSLDKKLLAGKEFKHVFGTWNRIVDLRKQGILNGTFKVNVIDVNSTAETISDHDKSHFGDTHGFQVFDPLMFLLDNLVFDVPTRFDVSTR